MGAPQYIDLIRDSLRCLSIIEAVNSGGRYVGSTHHFEIQEFFPLFLVKAGIVIESLSPNSMIVILTSLSRLHGPYSQVPQKHKGWVLYCARTQGATGTRHGLPYGITQSIWRCTHRRLIRPLLVPWRRFQRPLARNHTTRVIR